MKKLLLLILLIPVFAHAQIIYYGPALDSTTFTFSGSDSLIHYIHTSSPDTSAVIIDTSGSRLWQIGNTHKVVFTADTNARHGIMTDTLNPYPANANDYFVLKISNPLNCIIDFWHKYQTHSMHAGGAVEFSTDSSTWMNIAACPAIQVENFYTATDTLLSGQAAFMGTSSGEQLSRFLLVNCIGAKTTATTCFPNTGSGIVPVYLRFRFISDTTTDTLSGWMIDSIKVDYTGCGPGGVKQVNADNSLKLFPDPATNELTITSAAIISNVRITNFLGQTIYEHTYSNEKVQVNVADLSPGIYLIRINNTEVRKFVKQ